MSFSVPELSYSVKPYRCGRGGILFNRRPTGSFSLNPALLLCTKLGVCFCLVLEISSTSLPPSSAIHLLFSPLFRPHLLYSLLALPLLLPVRKPQVFRKSSSLRVLQDMVWDGLREQLLVWLMDSSVRDTQRRTKLIWPSMVPTMGSSILGFCPPFGSSSAAITYSPLDRDLQQVYYHSSSLL